MPHPLNCQTPLSVTNFFVDGPLIFDPGSICTQNSLNWAKSNYGFHWKFKGDRASIWIDLDSLMAIFGFRHLQGVNSQSWTKSSNVGYVLSL